MGTKRITCKFCGEYMKSYDSYVSHIESSHSESIPQDMTAWRFVYYLKTGKTHGSCIICKNETEWNEKTHKYHRFCNNPKCKEKYVETFQNRMIGKYGKVNLLNDPEQQKKMLANRKISGVYIWRDHVHETPYTGTYELSFLKFLDEIMEFNPEDVIGPSPHTYFYIYEGQKHFYIPDFFIPSLNLEIEIKEGTNNHPKIQAVDKVKERLKDEVMKSNSNSFNYIKIIEKNNFRFIEFLDEAKKRFLNGDKRPIVMCESVEDNLFDELITENIGDKYIRITYNGNGIYQEFKENVSFNVWKEFKNSNATKWLPIPPIYEGNYKSYFTIKGYKMFMKETYPFIIKYLDKNKIKVEEIHFNDSPNVVYKDEFQIVVDGNSDIITENKIINDKDIYYNKDKFDSGEINLCFITGHSGSGKSTMGRDMESDRIEHYDLDDVISNWNFSDSNLKEYGDLIYSFFRGFGKKYRYTSRKDWDNDPTWDNKNPYKDAYEISIIKDFIKYTKYYVNSHKNIKFVIEGVWIFHFIEPKEIDNYAVYIKGTSQTISSIRAAKRDSEGYNKFKKSIDFTKQITSPGRTKKYIHDEQKVVKFRNYFKDKIKKQKIITETVEDNLFDELITENNKFHLYHISNRQNIKTINPSIPNNFMTKNNYEENKTKRVCFAPSIDQCLMGLSRNCEGEEFYIYTPTKDYKTYSPNIKDVPDSGITGEIWIKEPVDVICLGKIKVLDTNKSPGKLYTYGNGQTAELYAFDYKWIEKYKQKESPERTKNYIRDEQKVVTESVDDVTNKPIIKTKNTYMIKNDKGTIISKLNYYEYKVKNFDWILMADLDTKPDYRGRGLATKLINELYSDITKNTNKGLYLFVKSDNRTAIRLYTKLNFKKVKNYTLEDGEYIIMAKGNADMSQFDKMNFS